LAFRGNSDHTLDAKHRLSVPARHRGELSERVVLSLPLDQTPCVTVWRPDDYDEFFRAALEQLPPLSNDRLVLQRFVFGSSHPADIDSAGRIMIPSSLIDHAGIRKEVVVVGAEDHLELWDRARWADQQTALFSGVAQITARFGHPD
jgi:MraZ protein